MSPRAPAEAAEAASPGGLSTRGTARGGPLDLELLYRRYGDMVFSRCRTLLSNEADAAEAAQETFLRVWRYRDSFRGESSPVTYLYKVATTTALNRLRTQRRHPELVVDELPPSIAFDPDHTQTAYDVTRSRQLLRLVLAEEDEGTVQCLIYFHLDGLTYAEIGELVGLSPSGVRKRLGTFRARLTTARADHDSLISTLFAEEEP